MLTNEDGASTSPPRLEGVETERVEGDTSRMVETKKGFLEIVPIMAEREVNVDEVDLNVITTTVADIPEEIWLAIFEMLDPSDMLSCYRTTPQWQKWLSPKSTSFLFLEVAPLLLKQLPIMPPEDMLTCRSVCSARKRGFDDAYQRHPHHLCLDTDEIASDEKIPEVRPNLWDIDRIQEFFREVEGHPDNPFPGRSISLPWPQHHPDIPEGNDGHLCRESARQLMDNFGHHLYFADFYLYGLDFIDGVRLYMEEFLRDSLLRLPNLKRLHVYRTGFDEDDGLRMEGNGTFFKDNPLPRLLHLESFSVVHGYYEMISEMLRACCVPQNIKRLIIYCLDNVLGLYEQVYSFHNLEVLYSMLAVEDLEKFGSQEQLPPLRQVVFRVCNRNSSSYEEVDFKRVFTAIELFSNSLEDVKVVGYGHGFRNVLRMDPSSNYKVNLPKLKKLRLGNYDGPLEPLFQLSSLKHLEIKFMELSPGAGTADVVCGLENRVYRTNVWNMLPCLKTLEIGRNYRSRRYLYKTYDRKCFENEMNDWKGCVNVKGRCQNIK